MTTITSHAVDQYRQRVRDVSEEEARATGRYRK